MGSLRNNAAENPVRVGAMNVNTVASDNDRCCREEYIPERVTKLKTTEKCPEDRTVHPTLRNPGGLAIPERPVDPAMGPEFSANT
jgi:hypothetical protein